MERPIALGTVARRGAAALALSLLGNWTVRWSVLTTGRVEPFGALGVGPVTFVTIVGTVAATAVYGAFTRISPRPNRLFVRVAAVALPVSFAPDLVVLVYDPGATVGAVGTLMAMHVLVAVVCVVVLTGRVGRS